MGTPSVPHVHIDASVSPCGKMVVALHLHVVAPETENHEPAGLGDSRFSRGISFQLVIAFVEQAVVFN